MIDESSVIVEETAVCGYSVSVHSPSAVFGTQNFNGTGASTYDENRS